MLPLHQDHLSRMRLRRTSTYVVTRGRPDRCDNQVERATKKATYPKVDGLLDESPHGGALLVSILTDYCTVCHVGWLIV